MYVLTEGWYEDREIKGVVDNFEDADRWSRSERYRDYSGPYAVGEVDK